MRRFFTFVIIVTACLANVQAITDNQLKALAQKLADVQGKEVYIYNKTQGKYVAQGGDAGTSTVFDYYGTVFTINSGNTISTKYGTGCYLGVSGSTVRVNLTTPQAWTFTESTSDGITTYSIKCNNTPIVSDVSDGYVLISKDTSLDYAKDTSKKGGLIDLSALIKDSRFDRGNSEASAWTFDNTGSNGYRRAIDQTAQYPAQNTYYHLVGVYDKEAQKVRFYKEGVLCQEVDAIGKFNFPVDDKYQWFCVGGDPGPSSNNQYVQANQALPGNIVATRLYSKAMTSEEVAELYGELKNPQTYVPVSLVSSIDYARNILAKSGCVLPIHATGFTTSDQIMLSSTFSTDVLTYKPKFEDGVANITFDDNIKTGKYYMTLKRGEKQQTLGTLVIVKTNTIEIPVVAHRGIHSSGGITNPQNSRAGLRASLEKNLYGCETDVRLSSDGVLMINHDRYFNTSTHASTSTATGNVDIEGKTKAQIQSSCTLTNKETLPTLDEFLTIMRDEYTNSKTKLVIEIKTNSAAAGQKAIETVNKYASLKDRIEFISFNTAPLDKIHSTDPTAIIQLLRDEKSTATTTTPAEVNNKGWHGIDYKMSYLASNQSWYDSAHTNGLFVNVWTINTTDEATTQRNLGADFLTANNPLEVKTLYENDARYKEYYDLNRNK